MSSNSICTIFSEWAKTHSCPAISNASQANGKIIKVFWILAFVLGTAFTLFFIYSNICSYYQYPIKITIRNELNKSIPFPSVSFCNLNRFKVDEIEKLPVGPRELWKEIFFGLRNTHEWSDRSELTKQVIMKYTQLDESTRIQLGHKLEDVMLDCVINGNKCDSNNITLINHYLYGNCFRFDSDIKANNHGVTNNIILILFTEQDKYVTEVTEGPGFVLAIHDKNIKPDFTNAFLIQSNLATHIGLGKKIIERLPFPFQTNCSLDNSIQECEHQKMQQEFIDTCKCYVNSLPFNAETRENIKACGRDENKCVYELLVDIKNREEGYYCTFPCKETQFTSTMTSIKWPNSNILSMYKKMLNEKYNGSFKDVSDHHLSSQLAKVVIYFDKMDVEIIEENALLTRTDLFSNIGGIMGLMLGFSICSLFEFLPLIAGIISNLKGKIMKNSIQITE